MREIWKPVKDYDRYDVSNKGRVRSFCYNNSRILKTTDDGKGYPRVSLWKKGRSKNLRVHNIVLESFYKERPFGMEGCHNDGNPKNNNVSNLRWGTHKENMADKLIHNSHCRGEKSGKAKLTEKIVREIRDLLDYGMTNVFVSDNYKITSSHASAIKLRKRWGWLK